MKNERLRDALMKEHKTIRDVATAVDVDPKTVQRWLDGRIPHARHRWAVAQLLSRTEDDLWNMYEIPEQASQEIMILSQQANTLSSTLLPNEGSRALYATGIRTCWDLYFSGHTEQVAAILPLYSSQTAIIAQEPSLFQKQAAALASEAYQLTSEIAADLENFSMAQQAGDQALLYAQVAQDNNLQISSLIRLATLFFHRKQSLAALRSYQQALSLLTTSSSRLLEGRVHAGLAEVYGMRLQKAEALSHMGLAYKHYPECPQKDVAYPYTRASHYSLYVFGEVQTRLFLHQPEEATKTLAHVEQHLLDPQEEPITKVDLLYYQIAASIMQDELEGALKLLSNATISAKTIGSRLYFNKLVLLYQEMQAKWKQEKRLTELEELFQY